MFKHILVPTDGSSISHLAEDQAIEFSRQVGAALTFIHVMPEAPFAVTDFSESGHVDLRRPRQFVEHETGVDEKIIRRVLDKAETQGVTAAAVTETSDSPYLAIIGAAERLGCDLIFMASHGRKGLQALLLGSETQKVLTHCRIPVLVFR